MLLLAVAVAVLLFSEDDRDGPAGGGVSASGSSTSGVVTRVVDGDTAEVELAGGEEDVRYIGIDTPESVAPGQAVECYGHAASDVNEELVEGERVRLVFDDERRDKYGRLLAYVHRGPLFVNAELVRRGYARTLEIAPNTDHAPRFERLERQAAAAGRGLWGDC